MKKLPCYVFFLLVVSCNFAFAANERVLSFEIIDSTGNFIPIPIDNNMDGLTATYSVLQGKSKALKGNVTIYTLSEIKIRLDSEGMPTFCTAPDGQTGVELDLVKASSDYRLKNGDHIFTEAESMELCANLTLCFDESARIKEGCRVKPVIHTRIIGGTGKFACASGEGRDETEALALVADPNSNIFGSVLKSHTTGTIRIPEKCDQQF